MGRRADRATDQAPMKLAFGDFMPDLPDHASPGVAEAVNVYPGSIGFRPVGQFLPHADALPLPCKGAQAFIAPSGRLVLIAGTSAGLYRQTALGWVEIGFGYSLGDDDRWRFVQFGEIAIVSNAVTAPLKINLETDAVASLGGSPPTMQALAVVNNFVVGTQAGGQVNRVAWSGENNSEWWTYAQRKSDYNDFPDGGEITGIVGGEVGLILQRSAVRRMAYVGGNVLFRFDKISSNVGCATVHSVAQHGELAFWYSENGFKMWDGAQIKSIGFERVDKAFEKAYGAVNYAAISTAVDGQRNTVCWSMGRAMWLYNWLLDKWSVIEFAAEIVTGRAQRAPSLEEQDAAVGSPDDDVDGTGLDSFDAGRFTLGDPVFYVFQTGVLGTFSGINMASRVSGRQIEMIEGRDARLRRIRPMTDAISGITVRLDTRQRLGDGARRTDVSTLQASGEMPVRARGRFVRAFVTIAAGTDWSYLQGVDATLEAGGRR
jgi:hypothetical protein